MYRTLWFLCCSGVLAVAVAQTEPKTSFLDLAGPLSEADVQQLSTQQIYERFRVLEVRVRVQRDARLTAARDSDFRAMSAATANGLKPEWKSSPLAPESESEINQNAEKQLLLLTLEARGSGAAPDKYAAALGLDKRARADAMAAFYAATLAQEAAKLASDVERPKLYAKVVTFWKQAGEAGEPGGFWNLAVMCQNGEGVTRSKLAAVEWYYKAGVAYLGKGEREKALAALEAVRSIDATSGLAQKLAARLKQGEPQ